MKWQDGQITSRIEESCAAKGNAFAPRELPLAAMATRRGSVRACVRARARQGSDTVDRHAASAGSWSGCWGGPGGAAMARGPAGGAVRPGVGGGGASACLEDLDWTRWPAGGSPLRAFYLI